VNGYACPHDAFTRLVDGFQWQLILRCTQEVVWQNLFLFISLQRTHKFKYTELQVKLMVKVKVKLSLCFN
jgi:hypothetical protein